MWPTPWAVRRRRYGDCTLGLLLLCTFVCVQSTQRLNWRPPTRDLLSSSAATNVSTYWSERDGGALRLQRSHPAQSLATALIAAGLAPAAPRAAERLAEAALARDPAGTGGPAAWALAHCLAAEGRAAEMVSRLAGFDGTQGYEASGHLHFHARMQGYGGIAVLDRRGAGAVRSATRLYDGFGSVLEYSGNTAEGVKRGGEEVCLRDMRVPITLKKEMVGAVRSTFADWFGGGGGDSKDGAGQSDNEQPPDHSERENRDPIKQRTFEDVLCWLPPSPLLLTHATALLFRLTLCDGMPESDDRWVDLKAAWTFILESGGENDESNALDENKTSIEFMPLAMLAASLLIEPDRLYLNKVSQPLECAMQGLHKMGRLMRLGELPTEVHQSDAVPAEEWKEVLRLLARARDAGQRWEMPTGMLSPTYLPPDATSNASRVPSSLRSSAPALIGWDTDLRQFLEHALCRAASEAGDYESLCLARAVCSEGTTLRANCPELWWRYGAVLDLLGDEVAAENARAASVSLGGGEGGPSF